eukprot:GEMP01090722.1.p1 GENE.GEMP01090722.1~~GEMP01090722.1.p1  ORF type:complete len:140 (+),score=14.11 GEMP01090722.1:156-575(+)
MSMFEILHNGPGRLNKYQNMHMTRSMVNYRAPSKDRMESRRPLWQNPCNPYQYDIAFINRIIHAQERAYHTYETEVDRVLLARASSEPSLTERSNALSRRMSCPEVLQSARNTGVTGLPHLHASRSNGNLKHEQKGRGK